MKKSNKPSSQTAHLTDQKTQAKPKRDLSSEIYLPHQKLPPAHKDLLRTYLIEVRKYPLLSPEEEKRLAIKYFEERDAEAASQLVKANLRFVIKIAMEYFKFGAKLIDVIQEGNIGLMHAVREYNPYKGVRLTSYAVWWIKGYIKEYLLKNYSQVKIATTHSQRKLFYNLQNEINQLESKGFEPTNRLLSQRLDVPEKEVETMKVRMASQPIYLDAPSKNQQGHLIDRQAGEDQASSIDEILALKEQLALLKNHIDKIKPSLNEKELYILNKRLLADQSLTLKEVGDFYGITRERVRQIESHLIEKLRQSLPTSFKN